MYLWSQGTFILTVIKFYFHSDVYNFMVSSVLYNNFINLTHLHNFINFTIIIIIHNFIDLTLYIMIKYFPHCLDSVSVCVRDHPQGL